MICMYNAVFCVLSSVLYTDAQCARNYCTECETLRQLGNMAAGVRYERLAAEGERERENVW